jgi:hypothetical protein
VRGIPPARRPDTSIQTSIHGAFTIRFVPPGDYLLAALTDLDTAETNDPALLEQLAKAAARVTLRDGETTRQDFRIGLHSHN